MSPAADLADCSALTLLALYRSGDASPVEATRDVLDRIERFNPILNAFCHLAPDEALAAGARERSALAARRAVRRARRRAGVGEGPDPRRRLADAARLAHRRSGRAVGRRRAGDRAPARSRRGDPRQDRDARVRLQGRDQLAADRHHAQPVESGEDAGRVVGRHGGRGRLRHGAALGRHRRRRQRPHPGRVLRQLRPEAELRPRPGLSALADGNGRPSRPARDERRRRGADDERAEAPRRARLDLASLRPGRLHDRPRRRHPRPAHRLLADARLREGRSGSRRRRRRRRRAAAGARRARRGGRSRHRRSARDHDRPLVRRRARDLERPRRRRSRRSPTPTFAPRPSSARPTARSTSSG